MIDQKFKQYKIVSELGRGGMGIVYLADDQVLGRKVALKFLPASLQQDEIARKRFLREASSAASIDHPYICKIYELDKTDQGRDFIVMEYVEGHTLQYLMREGSLSLDEILQIASQIAEALDLAHQRGIVHRDLKPANIMVTEQGHAKVMDYGLAKRVQAPNRVTQDDTTASQKSALTREGTTLGTVAYMSPEQLDGQPIGTASDIFAFGICFYELLTGVHPFRKSEMIATVIGILNEEPLPLKAYREDLPPVLQQTINRMLAKKVKNRIQDSGELSSLLQGAYIDQSSSEKSLMGHLLKPRFWIPALCLVAILLATSYMLLENYRKVLWARMEALPEIERLVEESWRDFTVPYELAVQAEQYIPNDPRLIELLKKCSLNISIQTEPEGVQVYAKAYRSPDLDWEYLGVTPLVDVRLAKGIFRWRFEKEGFQTVFAAAANFDIGLTGDFLVPAVIQRTLDPTSRIPEGMVRVPGAETPFGKLEDFFIDRYEVTNREFKRFVDEGGYQRKELWKNDFTADGEILSWEEAVKQFVDQTGRPGPATWHAGDFPEGWGSVPVSGVSWYEAAAYAEYRGRSLPTSTHWGLSRGDATTLIQWPQLGGYEVLAPFSNFRGEGPLPAGSLPGISSFGAFDMAGNVREWCWNKTLDGRLIRGGAWNDATYMFDMPSQAQPMDRSPENGFRCAFYPDTEKLPEAVFGQAGFEEAPDFYAQEPVSDPVFEAYKEQFSYDPTPLNEQIESVDDSMPDWRLERIFYDAPYGGERIIANLFLPKNAAPPYQTVVYFPGEGALFQDSSQHISSYFEFPIFLSFIVKNGRAVLFPVYQGTFERQDPSWYAVSVGINSRRYTEYQVQLMRDIKRSIDYLETRSDVDPYKLAYYGVSWGAKLGAILLAVEDRFETSILLAGGLDYLDLDGKVFHYRPDVDPVNYLGRIRTPTLMINGRYDMIFPLETSIQPMFDLLGTPEVDKQLRLFETDHIPPRTEFIKESLTWLDHHLGPVEMKRKIE